jgi:hypothetical protein
MAIKYTVQDGTTFEIGAGFDEQGQSEAQPIVAPFPNYSISRETISTPDGTLLGNKYSISINGKILASALSDITVSGEKQNNIQKQLIWHLKLNKAISKDHNIGRLEIEPYGGLANKYIFDDARLMNINIPEQPEDSSGVLYADYSFSFEAYKESSYDSAFPGSSICNKVSSFDESWEVTANDGQGGFLSIDANSAPYNTYTINHTVSAVGLKSLEENNTEVRLAWKNAADFVKTRLVSSPTNILTSDIAGNNNRIVKTFDSRKMGDSEDASIFGPDLTQNNYSFYGHTRVPRCDFSGGSYSVTETWIASNCQHPATLDMSVETSIDESGLITMTLSGTINGLISSGIVNTNTINTKLDNAEKMLALIDAKAFDITKVYYAKYPSTEVKGDTDLQNIIRSKSIGRNKFSGVITFSYTYNDNEAIVPNALSNSISLNYDNEDRDVNIIAIIPIIAKQDGPITQDMNTTRERKRSVTIDATMKKDFRLTKPNIRTTLQNYQPQWNHKILNWQETWQPINGSYSLNVEWVEVL